NEQLDLWAYNNRNELTGVNRHAGSNPDVPGAEDTDLRRAYTYDPIGNRKTYTEGTAAALYYCANALNQYEETGADADCVPFTEEFQHDADGNLTEDGQFVYTWDAENRLVAVEPAGTPGPGDVKVTFGYDYQNRRVWKKVFA